jgi:arylsulfatase
MVGKWHVTKKVRPKGEADKHNWPLQRGFDRFFGTIHGAGSFYDPNSLTRDNTLIPPDSPDFFYTDAIANHAVELIADHDPNRPLFMYVAFTAPHWPMHARQHNIAKYDGVYDKGWDAIRDQRHQRMREMGIVDARWALTPRDPKARAWADADMKAWHIRCMQVYAAMIDCLDQGVGQIVDALRESNRLDQTLILFLADNGGCAEGMGRSGPYQARPTDRSALRPMSPGALQYDMVPKFTRDGYPVRQGRGVMPGAADTYIAYGLPWANASNTPFRRYKHWVHEGGIASPLIAHWPEGIDPSLRGRLVHEPGHLIDLMATCVDLSTADYPTQRDGDPITPMEGVSLRPALEGRALDRKEPLFFEHEGNRALRDGRWKLVAQGARGPWELYDMEADRTELNNLAPQFPERTAAMAQRWEEWAQRAQVKPWPYDP